MMYTAAEVVLGRWMDQDGESANVGGRDEDSSAGASSVVITTSYTPSTAAAVLCQMSSIHHPSIYLLGKYLTHLMCPKI